MTMYEQGFLWKCAEMTKLADPPHKGLNDDNPLARQLYKNHGWIAQNPSWYFKNVSTPKEYNDQSAEMYRWAREQPKGPDGYWSNDTKAALFDARRKRGGVNNSWFSSYSPEWPGDTPVPEKSHIVLGSYPGGSVSVLKHERGHGKDYVASKSVQKFENQPTLQGEYNAWYNAGYKPGDPERDAALSTYWYGQLMKHLPMSAWDSAPSRWLSGVLHDRLLDVSARNYRRVDDRYLSENPDAVPVIHDYNSALKALNTDDGDDPDGLSHGVSRSMYLTMLDPEFFDDNGKEMDSDEVDRLYPGLFEDMDENEDENDVDLGDILDERPVNEY